MFGRGVIATQYAWAFEKAGHNVEFYIRPGRKAELGEKVMLNIYDARKKISGVLVNENWTIKLREDLNANYDLIIVSVQHYHFKSVIDVLSDKIGNATVLIFNNLWEEPQQAAAKIPESQLVWGFPQAGGGFDDKGILNGSLLDRVIIGTFGKVQTARGIEVIGLFKSSGFKIKQTKDFRSYLLSHFVLNAALHLENIKSGKGLSISSINDMQTTRFWRNFKLNGKELFHILKARNVNINANSEMNAFSLPAWILSFIMKVAIKFMPSMKQILTGHSNPAELKSYCKDVQASAEELRISLPRYEAAKKLFQ